MVDHDRSKLSRVKIPPPLNLREAIQDEGLNQKTARILKNDLLLHEAVIKNESDSVRKVLKETVDVDSRNNYGRAPIHWAASRGNTEIIEMLIQAKCDIEAKDKYGMRPLHMAAWYGHQEAVRMLINAGANVTAVNKKQYTLLMCASRGNSVGVVEYLTEAVESLSVDATDCTGATALHHAAVAGHRDVILSLSKIPEMELDAKDKKGQTPMHYGCAEGHTEAVEALISLGGDVNAQDNEGNTPLHVATRTRHTSIAQTLLKSGSSTEIGDEIGLTALHVAASQGCKGILESILQHGNINKQCNNGNTPLHLACENNEIETVEILINKGADPNCLNLRLQSPIHIAAEMGHTDICKLLLAAGANIEQREKSGRTPLYIAARGSFTAIVDMIIKTSRLDYPSPEDSNSDREVRELTPARRRWREGSRGGSTSSSNNSHLSQHVRSILWKLAFKQLAPGDWKKLALHWAFTHDQITAIEHQYTGPSSWKEHGYRMLLIWTSGLSPETQLTKELYEALSTIGKKSVAETIRKQLEQEVVDKTKLDKGRCHKCAIA
ncbi:ankyrin repeat and death domain-containing protein 1A-like isoform X2 [Venturia canescens]|uniref:ankyrin repeat and death domain-containing protein 1A-like isoform X2 n=1 Tax=Venturia canescens TaxID=32260 RepID=UPI001C9C95A3|nr:ankyrin repeat and death domain-containing protein 1A-like isoform X2 [Venturia canescens]